MRIATGLLLTAVLSACASGPDYRPAPASALGVPDAYHGPGANPGEPQQLATWWQRFDDPLLTDLVDRSIAGNLDLAAAAARLRQAREALVQARAGYLPSVGASAGVNRSIGAGNDSTNFSLGGDAAWEADLFGGIRRSVEAARADKEGAGFDLAGVRVAIVAETANNYISARLAQERLAIARDSLAIADDNLDIAGWRVQAGLVSSLDSEQARAARAQTAASIPNIETSYAAAAYRLAVLTGQAPGAINPSLDPVRPVPTGPADIAVGIPADTLRQRPDVRGAERSLAAATARIGVAEAQLYPALRIGGNIGTSAFSIGGLFDAITGSLFAGLSQTIFDGGRLRSQVRSQQAAADGAYASYRQTVLTGLEDVENALQALTAAERRQREFAIAFDAASNTAILARSQYRAGLTDFQTLLEAERSLLSSRDGQANARADRAFALVQLYRALGGGWDPLAEGSNA
ncbi:efflux transporter outer membrane subunit [Allosphingosinicella indica]|uniref:Efflux transporter, outer membrane factor (OMF) lipoprotein, NodT family n=1 Tax=Allosphingosinicella indica TaxID=941907 RepID=A0A1X7FZV9_9SPHN|nr:efflux transporter outer membrane subunit [Allosphingosinicella indica]SMF61635.1 efflux transporter, outer membrane factor (OMF) lipoprotein, NodT family [Allosphingosinicella indica]